MSAYLVKTRRPPSRQSRDARVYGHTTTTMHKLSTPFPPLPKPRPEVMPRYISLELLTIKARVNSVSPPPEITPQNKKIVSHRWCRCTNTVAPVVVQKPSSTISSSTSSIDIRWEKEERGKGGGEGAGVRERGGGEGEGRNKNCRAEGRDD